MKISKKLINQADQFYWKNHLSFPDLDGEQIENKTHREIMRLAAAFAADFFFKNSRNNG